MGEGRRGDDITCPRCRDSMNTRIIKSLPSEREKEVIVMKKKCKCDSCGYVWVDKERWS